MATLKFCVAVTLAVMSTSVIAQTADAWMMNNIIVNSTTDDTRSQQCTYKGFYDWWHYILTCRTIDKNGNVVLVRVKTRP